MGPREPAIVVSRITSEKHDGTSLTFSPRARLNVGRVADNDLSKMLLLSKIHALVLISWYTASR